VVLPHVPDCSPVAISSIPLFVVYVLGIFLSYAAISSQLGDWDGDSSLQEGVEDGVVSL